MPVTARLSKKFYDRFGEDVVAELVDWFNEVDATYKTNLRELNELNFGRFDAKLEQRLAESDARMTQALVELESRVNQRFVELEARTLKALAEVDHRFVELEARFDGKLNAFETRLRGEIVAAKWDVTKLVFALWASLMIPIIGLWFR